MGKSRRKRAARVATRSKSNPRRSLVVRTRAIIMGLLPTLAIFLGTRQLLAEAFRIPSGSMEPTLGGGLAIHSFHTDRCLALWKVRRDRRRHLRRFTQGFARLGASPRGP